MRKIYITTAAIFMAATALAQESAIIYDTPEGTLKDELYRAGFGFEEDYGDFYDYSDDGIMGSIVEGNDGCLYVYNPVVGYPCQAWMKLEKAEGDKYVAKLPQDIYEGYNNYDDYVTMQLNVLEYDEDKGWYYTTTTQPNQITFTYSNGVLSQDTIDTDNPQHYILGLTADIDGTTQWQGYGDYSNTWKPLAEPLVEAPADATFSDYSMEHVDGIKIVKIAFDGSDAYMKGLISTNPEAVVKGQFDGSKLTFSNKQYLGADKSRGYHEFFYTATVSWEWDEYWEEDVMMLKAAPSFSFDYDADSKSFASSEENTAIVINGGKGDNVFASYVEPSMTPFVETAATPADPEIYEFSQYNDYDNFGYVLFDIPLYDKDGNSLNPEKLYYNVYINDELKTLTQEDYFGFDADYTDVPFNYTDNYDLYLWSTTTRKLYFYYGGIKSVGIQSVYKGGDETRKSNLVTYQTELSSVAPVAAGDVKSVVYHDMAGRRVADNAKGLVIKTTTFADGTVTTTKVVRF